MCLNKQHQQTKKQNKKPTKQTTPQQQQPNQTKQFAHKKQQQQPKSNVSHFKNVHEKAVRRPYPQDKTDVITLWSQHNDAGGFIQQPMH